MSLTGFPSTPFSKSMAHADALLGRTLANPVN